MRSGEKNRRKDLDSWRGLAVLLMVMFHGHFNLYYLQLVPMTLDQGQPWWWLRVFISNSFLLLAGIGLFLAHRQGLRLWRFLRWWLPVAASACLISLATFWALPDQWIFFGILHLIAASALLAWPLCRAPKLALLLALLLTLLYCFTPYWQLSHWWPDFRPALGLPRSSLDYYPLLPHGIALLVGIGYGPWLPKHDILSSASFDQVTRPFAFIGRHALLIYLGHQAVLLPAAYVVQYFITG